MAVFVAASDEATDGTATGPFLLGGWVGREALWSRVFAKDWQRRVLSGPPKIDYLHMADMRSRKWREKHGVSEEDAERRIDAAFDIIHDTQGIFPILYRLHGGHLKTEFAGVTLQIRTEGGVARKKFEPDYLCFLHYALEVLNYVSIAHPYAEKVDFVVERNGQITKHIQRFYRSMRKGLIELEREDLARLVGELIPGGKDRVPLQAADLLCWYTQNSDAGTLNTADRRRYAKIATRKGVLEDYTKQQVSEFAERARRAVLDFDDEDT